MTIERKNHASSRQKKRKENHNDLWNMKLKRFNIFERLIEILINNLFPSVYKRKENKIK